MTTYHCSNCHRILPEEFNHRCPTCGGVFDIEKGISFNPDQIAHNLPRMWRYRHTFGLPIGAPMLSLGEGDTPLIQAQAFGREVSFKLEYLNPTGSFKDRGTAPTLSYVLSQKITEAVEDSSGNAGASFAAYAARAGIKGRVYVPDYASGPKRSQIEAFGADVVRIVGPRSAAAEAVRKAVEDEGAAYASHAYLPHGLTGYATIAYELIEQMEVPPVTVIAPVGHGSLLLGIARGFEALKKVGTIDEIPRLIGVQARACAPLWAVSEMGAAGLSWMTEGQTVAEGVRVKNPVHGDALLQFLQEHGGQIVAVEEEDILPGRNSLAKLGFYVEPTSAIVWPALETLKEELSGPVVVILSGNGLKASYEPAK
ncbi:MAG: pyridoxal-phosphate dependent enzyme [Chloroflexi bacterium]|nr:MAG: pyridoxal-phosphate dependent enzyme [Chloroflexota bacterium]MBL1193561.1 pyridoxal-phosphate dependent enzyme [Chloroflexota bacterium]NOH10852.1 pyridoxal-phosphate dependent enzyme [Chloroflexota bacterium]